MNKYLVSSIIIFGIFIVFTFVIYNDIIELNDYSSEGSLIYEFDTGIIQARSYFFSSVTTEIMNILSDFGREYFWIIVPILLFVFGGIDGRIVAVIILLSFMLVIPLTTLVKDLIDRDRPLVFYGASVNKLPVDESYPSGHASMVSAGAVAALLLLRKSPRQKLISILLVIEAGLVCLSRLYLGVHYPTDLIGGILLGSGVTLLVTSAHNMIERLVKFKI
jgi:undecaprenyl-diphosphatase